MKKSISKRIRITKNNKILRRATGLSHSKSNKRTPQRYRKKGKRALNMSLSRVREILY